jgi:hypothetical protein
MTMIKMMTMTMITAMMMMMLMMVLIIISVADCVFAECDLLSRSRHIF